MATMIVDFGRDRVYELTLIIGPNNEIGINTYDYQTIELSQESIYAWCLFHEQSLHEKTREKLEKTKKRLENLPAQVQGWLLILELHC